jgi:hypothetical protein
MKTWCIALLALGFIGFQSRGLSDRNSFPIGTYASCAQGVHNPSGNRFLNASGFQDRAALTLAQRGTTVTSSYIDASGVTQSLSFSATTGATATLTQKGQVIPGFGSLCVLGPGNATRYPASMAVNGGTLTYNAGTVFLALTGDLRSDAGSCGTLSQPGASFWVVCKDRRGNPLPSIEVGPPPVTEVPAGQYSCVTQIETVASINGVNHDVAAGASGTLALSVDGSRITGRYSGDHVLAGTLRYSATTPTTAIAETGQTLMAPCMVPRGTGVPPQTPEPLPIATSALMLTDSTLFVSFAGTTAADSSCPGANVAGSLICAR